MRRLWWAALVVACSGSAEPSPSRGPHATEAPAPAPTTTEATTTAPPATEATAEAPAPAPEATEPDAGVFTLTLALAWPAPASAEVTVTSEHDFGGGSEVSARYRYQLAVTRDDEGYRVARTGLVLESSEGDEPLRLGNVVAQDVTQHVGELRFDESGRHIRATSGFEPIDEAARAAMRTAGIDGAIADAVIALDRSGWEPLSVVDYDSMLHEWAGRTLALGIVDPADAAPGVSATRLLTRVPSPCDERRPEGPSCVELVRTEQGEQGPDRIEHVYTLFAEPGTLVPHRFTHESRTDAESAGMHYAETWTTTFDWR